MAKKKPPRKEAHNPLETKVKKLLFKEDAVPLTLEELAHLSGVRKDQLPNLQNLLDRWITEGLIRRFKQRYAPNISAEDSFTAKLRIPPKGFGFVQIYEEKEKNFLELFVTKENLQGGCDGDIVKVVVIPSKFPDKGAEGRVVEILERGRSQLAGIVYLTNPSVYIYAPALGTEKKIKVTGKAAANVKIGDHLLVKIKDWEKDLITTEFMQVIGNIKNASQDGELAKLSYGIPIDFPKNALKETDSYSTTVSDEEIEARRDLRKWECVTIDPQTAKDFDDAITLTQNPDKSYLLGVHIADVSHYVTPDSALDKEATLRSNSTYLPSECIPMLPETLSNGLCSLKPNVNRLTISALMHISEHGDVLDYTIEKTVIRSKKRFSYEDAKEVLDGKVESPHKELLDRMVELCHKLKAKRRQRGSVDFALPELVIQLDKDKEPIGVTVIPYDITHQMIEEFMLKANEIVAIHLTQANKPVLYRIHEPPNRSVLKDFVVLCRSFGEKLPDDPAPSDLQAFFERIRGAPFFLQVSTAFIRTMKIAYYSPENSGHYGLSLDHYCHFTSPIRRYADLIIERSLFDQKISVDALPQIAMHCSERERISMRAEMYVKLLKKIRLLLKWTDVTPGPFKAIITKMRPFGLFLISLT